MFNKSWQRSRPATKWHNFWETRSKWPLPRPWRATRLCKGLDFTLSFKHMHDTIFEVCYVFLFCNLMVICICLSIVLLFHFVKFRLDYKYKMTKSSPMWHFLTKDHVYILFSATPQPKICCLEILRDIWYFESCPVSKDQLVTERAVLQFSNLTTLDFKTFKLLQYS